MTKRQHPPKQTRVGTGRRAFLSTSLVAGGGLLLTDRSDAQTQDRLTAEVSVAADSLCLYTDLLDDIENDLSFAKLDRMAMEKTRGLEGLQAVHDKAAELEKKYGEQPNLTASERAEDFKVLLRRIEATNPFRRDLNQIVKVDIPQLAELPYQIRKIRDSMLSASKSLTESRPAEAREKIAEAIKQLALLPGATHDDKSRPGRLIWLLEGTLQFANAKENASTRHAHASGLNTLPAAASIDEILRKYLNPARWYRMITAKIVVYPALARTTDRAARLNLLRDGLRLVPGLVELDSAARDLADVTL